jgi:hypothetical protein
MQGILTEGGRLSAVDLLFKVAFGKKVNNIFSVKRNSIACTRRSTVMSLPFSKTSML